MKAEARAAAAACAARGAQPLLSKSASVTSWPVKGSPGPDGQGDLKCQVLWPRDRYLCALRSPLLAAGLLNLSQLQQGAEWAGNSSSFSLKAILRYAVEASE